MNVNCAMSHFQFSMSAALFILYWDAGNT